MQVSAITTIPNGARHAPSTPDIHFRLHLHRSYCTAQTTLSTLTYIDVADNDIPRAQTAKIEQHVRANQINLANQDGPTSVIMHGFLESKSAHL